MRTVKLIPLQCPKCRAPVPARPDEVAWVCEQCGQGMIIDSTQGARPLSVFFSCTIPAGKKGRPFWVSRGQVDFTARETYKGDEGRAAREFWAEPRLFFIPAWECSLEDIISAGTYLLKKPEAMEPGNPVPFLPVVASPGDVRAFSEFLIFSIEAERRDALKTVHFNLQMDPPQLWVLA